MKLSLNLDLIDFLVKLTTKGFLSSYDCQSLLALSKLRRNHEFLLNLDMYGEDCENEFFTFLKASKIELSNGLSSETHQSSGLHDRASYVKVHCLLLTRINANLIAIRLYEKDLLKASQLEQVLVQSTRMDRSRALCSHIERAASRPGFMEGLIGTLKAEQEDLHRQVLVKLLLE